jgi:hypothetical protein
VLGFERVNCTGRQNIWLCWLVINWAIKNVISQIVGFGETIVEKFFCSDCYSEKDGEPIKKGI